MLSNRTTTPAAAAAPQDGPSLPIVAEGDEEPNDTYVQQLTAGAEAAVAALVERGVTDPARVAVGGHSYGAFMAANLLAHCPKLFAAGVARSGGWRARLGVRGAAGCVFSRRCH